ncbi:MAG: hypothetical protein EA384_03345 [Spirochaetaceae bacterium]|nr:MAG: hypothetical protein EA384_03345 [Spirochaetaceae bacterium]
MYVSRSLVARFSRDMAQLYTDLLGLGEAVDSGALFAASQRLVEAVTGFRDLSDSRITDSRQQPSPADPETAAALATTVLIRLKAIDDRGLIPRPGRRRRLYGLALSMLRAVCEDSAERSEERHLATHRQRCPVVL